VAKRNFDDFAVSVTFVDGMNVRPGSTRHACGGNDYGLLVATANKVMVFEVVDVDLFKIFAFLYIGLAVDGTLNLGFRDFICRILLLDVRYDPIPAEQYYSK